MYIPQTKYVFPIESDKQVIDVNKKSKIVLDKKFNYYEKGFWFKFKRFFFRIALELIAYPITRLRYLLKVEGKENIKLNKKKLKKSGCITVSNHVFLWDYLALGATVKLGYPTVPVWGKIMDSYYSGLFRLAGGIPIPKDTSAFNKFYKAMDEVFQEKKWVHVYSETGLWFYYVPIREFKRGAAYFAYKYSVPIIPIGYSYRQPKGIWKLLNSKRPLITVHIGEPQYINYALNKKEAIEELTSRVRKNVMIMVGINSEEENTEIANKYYKYADGYVYTVL